MFQFHFGTIDSAAGFAKEELFKSFNSTLVRLIEVCRVVFYSHIFMFQFHFGTIDRDMKLICLGSSSKFQFHFGTIDSNRSIPFDQFKASFNSTLVRLIVRNALVF